MRKSMKHINRGTATIRLAEIGIPPRPAALVLSR
jgi:hypothetical protein